MLFNFNVHYLKNLVTINNILQLKVILLLGSIELFNFLVLLHQNVHVCFELVLMALDFCAQSLELLLMALDFSVQSCNVLLLTVNIYLKAV
jgi:hypothetical protein